MNFEYNGHLLENDRIDLVAKEIVDYYPQISLEKAKEAAMLEGRISAEKTMNDEFNRLYNLMLVNCDNKKIVSMIYNDYLNLIKNGGIAEDNIYISLVEEINAFLQDKVDFPLLADYQ